MSKGSITDPRVKILPSKELLDVIDEYKEYITELPENISKILKHHGYVVSCTVEIPEAVYENKIPLVDIKLLNKLCEEASTTNTAPQKDPLEKKKVKQSPSKSKASDTMYLYLSDLRWLNEFLKKVRKEKGINVYLHNLIQKCSLKLPENDIIQRNPELEARCQKLREEQQNQEYRKMTKNVDAVLKHYPEDTISYQMKAINSQIIAVLQFVLSVVAGFVFGFLGIELIMGNLDFGLRLLLGIMFALIIALAEIYFLAKKLSEYDNVTDQGSPYKKKAHAD